VPSDEGLAALSELARNTSEDERIQRAAVRALAVNPSDQARQLIRSLVERNDVSDRLRGEALASFERERTSSDDVAWLRSIYAKLENRQLKQRALSAIVRVSGPETDQWLMSIVKDDDEPSDLRATALRRIGKSMPIADIGKLYDASSERAVREQLINILGERKENDATDKLIEIVKTGTDPNLRAQAIGAMASKNDPRTRALLMEIVNK
jgi:HEAT repeat protein